MKKNVIAMVVIGILLLSSFVAASQDVEKTHIFLNNMEISIDKSIYRVYSKHEKCLQKENSMIISQDDGDNVTPLWISPGSKYVSLFSSFVNNDDIPDFLVNHSALDGITGSVIKNFEPGVICGLGDIDRDGIDEIFTKEDHLGTWPNNYCILYCLNISDGKIKWDKQFNTSWWILSISVGEVINGGDNEIVIGTGSTETENVVYCLDSNGEIIWRYLAGNRVQCVSIDDINDDGKNEVIAGTGYRFNSLIYCFNETGDILWQFDGIEADGWANFRYICIGELNFDPYKEIIVESTPDAAHGGGYGIRCLSGKNGSTFWTWYQEPDAGWEGSFQSAIITDIIPSHSGNEIILGGVCGIYCLNGENNPPPNGRVIWHAGKENGFFPGWESVQSLALGDLDDDGFLDIAAITSSWGTKGSIYAFKGQYVYQFWEYGDCGNGDFHSILCKDLTGDNISEVIATTFCYTCALLTSIGGDKEDPNVKITKPGRGLYIFNKKILPRIFRLTKIIGPITIKVDATDEKSGIKKVEFYINGIYMGDDTTYPYTFNWRWKRPRLIHLFIIKVIAYDNFGNNATKRMIVRKFL